MDKQNYDENIWDICNAHTYICTIMFVFMIVLFIKYILYMFMYVICMDGYEVNDELQIYWR